MPLPAPYVFFGLQGFPDLEQTGVISEMDIKLRDTEATEEPFAWRILVSFVGFENGTPLQLR